MSFDIRKEFLTDEKKEIEGVWESIGEGCSIKVARANNPNYNKWFTRLTKPVRRQLRNDTLPEKKSEQILIKLMAKTILLDWEGMYEGGVELEYSEENAIRLLTEYKDFRQQVDDLSKSIELFRAEEDEEAEKN